MGAFHPCSIYAAWYIFSFTIWFLTHHMTNGQPDNRIYTFAFSNDGFPANYVEDGKLVGQSVDMVLEICRYANKNCSTALVPRKDCWDNSEGFPPFSRALNQHWYASCANLPPSVERILSYEFMSESYLRTKQPTLIVAENSTLTLAELHTCTNYTLAYPADTALEPDCLLDLGWFVKLDNHIPVRNKGVWDLISATKIQEEMVREGQVDMALVVTIFAKFDRVKQLTKLNCITELQQGLNNMIRRDDIEFQQWFSDAVHEYMCVGNQYENFCQGLQDKYGDDPLCRRPGIDLDCSPFGGPFFNKDSRVPMRIFPCDNECAILEKGQTFYIFKDEYEDPSVSKALRGARRPPYLGLTNLDVVFTINLINDERRFVVNQLCLLTKQVRAITFVFRRALWQREEEVIPLEADDWIEACISCPESWNLVKIKLDLRKVVGQDLKVKVKSLWMDGCTTGS